MYSYRRIALVVAVLFLLEYCNAQSAKQIKASITAQNAFEFVGLGGRYGYMTSVVSKDRIIESDHFPPKSIYASAKDAHIQNLAHTNMAAVSLRYEHHRRFITTNNPVKGSAQANFIAELHQLFAAGKYYDAIDRNIGWYNSNPDIDGNSRSRFDQYIKVGIKDALEVHVINDLITDQQKQALIRSHSLNVRDPVMSTILNLEGRDRARELLLADIEKYRNEVQG